MSVASDCIRPVDDRVTNEFRPRTLPDDIRMYGSPESPTAGDFGKYEVEAAAGRLVSFFQARRAWVPFTILELIEFYWDRKWNPNVMFFGLASAWYDDGSCDGAWHENHAFLAQLPDGRYFVTQLFIDRCQEG